MNKKEIPILVVGGRTTGLTMACELARHGIAVRTIDQSPGIDPHCRATIIHSRTLEVFQDMGLVDEILAQSMKLRGMRQYANGQLFLNTLYDDVDSPYPFPVSLGQNRTEEILETQLNRLGVEVERQTELVAFIQQPDGVRATLNRADGCEEIVATPWLIGCDGAHSRVRHINGQDFPGAENPHQYVLADVVVDAPIPHDEWHGFLTDRGTLSLFVLDGERTLVAADLPEHHDAATEIPTLEEIQTLVSDRGPPGARVRDPRWLTYFRIHYRLARHYHQGRTFLAGDAAHIHSLLGGQGMNTGIQDAYNLAWKLALVARGLAPESLLESYEKERRAVGEDVVKTTKKITDQVEVFGHLSNAEREKLYFNVAVPEPERLAAAQHREELDLDYRKSPICVEPAASRPRGERFSAGPHAGAQAPDASPLQIDDRSLTLFEMLSGPKHSLLLFSGAQSDAGSNDALTSAAALVLKDYGNLANAYIVCAGANDRHPADQPQDVTIIGDPELALRNRYGAETECLYLIRPDGYIGYRDRPANSDRLQRYLEYVFEGGSRGVG